MHNMTEKSVKEQLDKEGGPIKDITEKRVLQE